MLGWCMVILHLSLTVLLSLQSRQFYIFNSNSVGGGRGTTLGLFILFVIVRQQCRLRRRVRCAAAVLRCQDDHDGRSKGL